MDIKKGEAMNNSFDGLINNQSETSENTTSHNSNENTGNNFNNLIDDPDPTPEPTPGPTPIPLPEPEPNPNPDIYTDDEIRDVNNIKVTIPDTQTPIVVLFGSPASGKTLSLLRMIRYLEQNSYQVFPEELFRPHTDKHYIKMCSELKNMVYSNYAPGGNDTISFMLVKVLDFVGHPVCQILEAPGEHYFNGSADLSFPTYINAIRTAPNKKVWVFYVEQDWGESQTERDLYAAKIREMQKLISPKDRIVFLFNKVDKHRHQQKPNGEPNKKVFFTNIQQQFPGIFTQYQNTGITKLLYGPYNFKSVCFSSGVFNKTQDGKEVWTPENDWYCREFWEAIR